jgi:hypothetical protein
MERVCEVMIKGFRNRGKRNVLWVAFSGKKGTGESLAPEKTSTEVNIR